MRTVNEKAHEAKKIEIMEKCFDCYSEHGINGIGIKGIAEACGCNTASLYQYFNNLDDLIVQSTAYCMAKVEDDFMAKAPVDAKDVMRFIEEVPYWTAKNIGLCIRFTPSRNISNTGRNFLKVLMRDTPNMQNF